ncbi:hypothetical protein KIN20_035568 [Parelaphostrongylus tenuis]|uniref:Uncharacterized protein n=1 Tax=Parelaphostrongylus tenuis TaxID=148309 RepID=A0AAD5RBP7_PARTN|nr:hypothetical protein KIN20_035568 [Parelaphostrongylus tenuis]
MSLIIATLTGSVKKLPWIVGKQLFIYWPKGMMGLTSNVESLPSSCYGDLITTPARAIKSTQRVTAFPRHGVLRRRSLKNIKLVLNGKCMAPYDKKSSFDKVTIYYYDATWNLPEQQERFGSNIEKHQVDIVYLF